MMKPYFETELGKLYCGDCLEVLKMIESESINCCMTSPPYWGLRDYGVEGQLGIEQTPEEYTQQLVLVFQEVSRVLKPDGTLWLNLGDSYSGSGGAGGWSKERNGQTNNENRKINGLKPKDLVGIPWRVAFALQADGWYLRNEIIWHKPNCMPSSAKDRFTVDFEKLFFFTKNRKYWFETQYEPMSDLTKQRDKYGYNSAFKGQFTGSPNEKRYQNTGRTIQYPKFFNEKGRIKRAVWRINTKPCKEAHFAVFPETLCETPIKAGCPVGGVVLDPFMGSGTTAAVCEQLNRRWCGIELNEQYCEIAAKRIQNNRKIFDI